MTFDEAVREYQLRSSIGPLVQGMKLSPFVNVPQQEYDRVKFLNNLFYEIINKLRKEYAPTIEMTKEQYKIFNEDIQLNQKALDDYIDELMGLPKITNRQMLNLYTHPETIKIVDE